MQKREELTQETKMIVSVTAFIIMTILETTRMTYIALESGGYIANQAGG